MSEPAPFLAPRSATRLAGVVLAGMASVVAFSVLDRPKAATLEKFAQSTAAGDRRYYAPPSPPLAIPEPALTWQGRPWAPAGSDKVKIDDPDMRRVGTDPVSGFSIYQPRQVGTGRFYIKIAVGEFLPLDPR